MLFRTSPEKFWNLIARKYAASPIADVAAYQKKIEKLKSYLSSEDYVLDIGCGTGTQCDDLANNVKYITGIDISNKLLAIAEIRKVEREIENVEFVQTTVFDERFYSGSFNVVMAFYVLHFYEDIDEVFRRIYDLLKPSGLFILETACLGEKNTITGKLIRSAGKLGFLPLINLLSNRQIELALEKTGFSVVEKTKFSESNDEYTLIAKKPLS
ncbi:MAG: class I SAM-dependent methyltransferase [Candidatus Thiodiazotropha endolucinida]|nr:class I SAM-dependent methyltransferase [Candidatus Thiodiazotropha taylori]MCW4225469.1 class I SAM-dependent methyltransferase [Candidatus Thiodiazotropha endolucinida]MCG7883247.1 class I SAM-dependent methyltransferase [Candidatus Thiodiazotropha taylori]MCG7887039.1 class I SAM-dependent methyltransferase [Candidatus Thiodiazotropha taylori]MCG7892025.1 class I SAM-dependent methyltransferase [Candidatus Thiodiazotropha taylori]